MTKKKKRMWQKGLDKCKYTSNLIIKLEDNNNSKSINKEERAHQQQQWRLMSFACQSVLVDRLTSVHRALSLPRDERVSGGGGGGRDIRVRCMPSHLFNSSISWCTAADKVLPREQQRKVKCGVARHHP